MKNDVVIPNFGELLAEQLGQLSPQSIPFVLARLERRAGERYRQWAQDLPDFSDGLLACANREDDIAERADLLFPISEAQKPAAEQVVPEAVRVFLNVFADLGTIDQITIQANAERQGAAAWRGFVDAYPQAAADLESLAKTEEANADYLDLLLSSYP